MKCFGFGGCLPSYIYILFTILLFFLKNSILSLGELSFNTERNIFGIEPVIKKYGLMKLLVEYFGYIIYGGIFIFISRKNKIFKKKENENPKSNNEFIFEERTLPLKSVKLLLITCCLFSIQLIIRNILNFLRLWMLDLWIFNIIFISFFLKKIFKIEIYKHQLYSLGINFAINFILLIAAACIKNSNGESEFDTIIDNFGNYFYIVLFYVVFLALSAIICLSQVLQKYLMDIEYYSPFSILFIIGIFSTFFTIISLIIVTNVSCSGFLSNKGFCPITRLDYTDGDIYYFDNFKFFIDNLGLKYKEDKKSFFIEIFLVYPLYSLACYLKYFFETMIIYHLNPNYVLISDNTFYSIKMIIGLTHDILQNSSLLILLGDIISLFIYFFYLEIFQLKCCNMNYNTRIRISERSNIDSNLIVNNDDDEEDDDDENNIENNDNNNNEMIGSDERNNEINNE